MTVRWERAATCYLTYVESGGITSAGGAEGGEVWMRSEALINLLLTEISWQTPIGELVRNSIIH